MLYAESALKNGAINRREFKKLRKTIFASSLSPKYPAKKKKCDALESFYPDFQYIFKK